MLANLKLSLKRMCYGLIKTYRLFKSKIVITLAICLHSLETSCNTISQSLKEFYLPLQHQPHFQLVGRLFYQFRFPLPHARFWKSPDAGSCTERQGTASIGGTVNYWECTVVLHC